MPVRYRLPRLASFESTNKVVIAPAPGDSVTYVTFPQSGNVMPFDFDEFDITVTGLGGLEGGNEAASTWYYLYLTPSSGEPRVIGSVQPPSNGPQAFTSDWVYICALRNDANSNLITVHQITSDIFLYAIHQAFISASTAYDSAVQSADISSMIPQSAAAAYTLVHNANSAGGGNRGIQWRFYHPNQQGTGAEDTTKIFKTVPTPLSDSSPTSYNVPGSCIDEFLYPTPGNPKLLNHRRASANPIGTPNCSLWFQGWIDSYLGD